MNKSSRNPLLLFSISLTTRTRKTPKFLLRRSSWNFYHFTEEENLSISFWRWKCSPEKLIFKELKKLTEILQAHLNANDFRSVMTSALINFQQSTSIEPLTDNSLTANDRVNLWIQNFMEPSCWHMNLFYFCFFNYFASLWGTQHRLPFTSLAQIFPFPALVGSNFLFTKPAEHER